MEEEAPEIYISGPLTEAGDVDFECEDKRTLENTSGPCGEQGNHTPFSPKNSGSVSFYIDSLES